MAVRMSGAMSSLFESFPLTASVLPSMLKSSEGGSKDVDSVSDNEVWSFDSILATASLVSFVTVVSSSCGDGSSIESASDFISEPG